MAGEGPFEFMVDLGTGTGRMLELFSERAARGSGIDNNTQMLRVARHKLGAAGRRHMTVRQGDLGATPLEAGKADLVTLHQVLHYLDDPLEAVSEAARLLSDEGCILIADFASHNYEEFRTDYAHRRLGFEDSDIQGWMEAAGLSFEAAEQVQTAKGRPDVKIWRGRKYMTQKLKREQK